MTGIDDTSAQDRSLERISISRTAVDVDQSTREAVDAYVSVAIDALQSMDAPPLVGFVLNGSRARGDHTDENDADLALVLQGYEFGRALNILRDLCWVTYDIEAKYGFMVSPTIIWSEILDSPELASNPAFYHNFRDEGITWDSRGRSG